MTRLAKATRDTAASCVDAVRVFLSHRVTGEGDNIEQVPVEEIEVTDFREKFLIFMDPDAHRYTHRFEGDVRMVAASIRRECGHDQIEEIYKRALENAL